jgi:proteasome alpha subunit
MDDEPRLFETDPSGTPREWRATAIGANDADVREFLEANYDDSLSVGQGVDLALEALAESRRDDKETIAPETVSVATIAPDYDELGGDERRSRLDALDLLDPADS